MKKEKLKGKEAYQDCHFLHCKSKLLEGTFRAFHQILRHEDTLKGALPLR